MDGGMIVWMDRWGGWMDRRINGWMESDGQLPRRSCCYCHLYDQYNTVHNTNTSSTDSFVTSPSIWT